jgi:hypothetical protein
VCPWCVNREPVRGGDQADAAGQPDRRALRRALPGRVGNEKPTQKTPKKITLKTPTKNFFLFFFVFLGFLNFFIFYENNTTFSH